MKYTSDDVRNVMLFKDTIEDAKVQKMEPLPYLRMMVDSKKEGDKLYERFLRGQQTAESAELMFTNDRYDQTNGTAYDMAAQKLIDRGCDSPVVEFCWGFAGTSQMMGVAALKEKSK